MTLYAPKVAVASDTLMVDKVIGIVGDYIVLYSDIEIQYQQFISENQNVPENMRCQILGQMLGQKLFLQQAKLDSVSVTDEEISGELDRRIRFFINMIGSVEKLEGYYGKSITAIKEEFKRDIADQLLAQKMQGRIFEKIKVTPSEVKTFFKNIPEDSIPYYNATVEIAQIVKKPEVAPEQKQLAIEKAEGLLSRLKQGENFATLATIYSEDPGSAAQGGNLGFVGRGELVTEFEGAAFRLNPDEISDIVKTKFGYHIIKMHEQKGEQIHISHILIKPKTSSFDLQNAIYFLDSVKKEIENGNLTFEKAVDRLSEDDESKSQGGLLANPQSGDLAFQIDELDKNVYFAIDKLKVGEVSKPQIFTTAEGEQAVRILKLKNETQAHVANLNDDYHKIKSTALQHKQIKELEKWIDSKIENIYIHLDPSYQTCPNLSVWYKKNQP